MISDTTTQKPHSKTQATALHLLQKAGQEGCSSWDFGAATVAWLRTRGYVLAKDASPPSRLLISDAGREAYARGRS